MCGVVAIYGFLGRNGAGKTTTIKMLVGLAHRTDGSVHVLGMDVLSHRMASAYRFCQREKDAIRIADSIRTGPTQPWFLSQHGPIMRWKSTPGCLKFR
jgi:ABC-type cobalamin/Fe3+-siderophores transport system ATPase subunit